jgi:hypothetical protein
MRQIAHDWEDSLIIGILKNVKGSMKSESRLLIRMRWNFLGEYHLADLLSFTDEYILHVSHQHDPHISTDMIVVHFICSLQ